ncbi:hypothetical protein [Litorihabitans aurantiacus]|uniref:Lipoprotein n=1 Tax=Litorihabitans aurantiacus TaxID=1930061 RepID=A0AA37XF81_9MICO|nr:hypothetical protein [Litorihabitans aurantiacus]GMA32029.1 hypothetical protein GCM10025875_20210 [Litorihabitans aurantiacus]
MRPRRPLAVLAAALLPALAACTSEPEPEVPTEPTAAPTTPVEIPGPQDREVTRVMIENGEVAQGQAELLPAQSRFRVEAACLSGDGTGLASVSILIDGASSTAKEMACNGSPVSIQMLGRTTQGSVQLSLAVPEGDDITAYAVGTAE